MPAPHPPQNTNARAPAARQNGGDLGPGIMLEHIKSPSEQDIAAMTDLWAATGLIPATHTARRDIENCAQADHGSLIVARREHDLSLLATMMTGHDGMYGWVHYLAVAPSAQNKGLGKTLLSLAEDILRATGLDEMRVTVDTASAGDFYIRRGFQQVESPATEKTQESAEKNTIMRKRLKP